PSRGGATPAWARGRRASSSPPEKSSSPLARRELFSPRRLRRSVACVRARRARAGRWAIAVDTLPSRVPTTPVALRATRTQLAAARGCRRRERATLCCDAVRLDVPGRPLARLLHH